MGVCFKHSYIQLHVDNCVDLQPLFAMNLIIACAHCCVNLVIMRACYTRRVLCVHTAATVSYEFDYSLCSAFCQPCNSMCMLQ